MTHSNSYLTAASEIHRVCTPEQFTYLLETILNPIFNAATRHDAAEIIREYSQVGRESRVSKVLDAMPAGGKKTDVNRTVFLYLRSKYFTAALANTLSTTTCPCDIASWKWGCALRELRNVWIYMHEVSGRPAPHMTAEEVQVANAKFLEL